MTKCTDFRRSVHSAVRIQLLLVLGSVAALAVILSGCERGSSSVQDEREPAPSAASSSKNPSDESGDKLDPDLLYKLPLGERCDHPLACELGLACSPEGRCVDCVTPRGCYRGFDLSRCVNYECVDIPCSDHDDCARGAFCVSGVCQGCVGDYDCTEFNECRDGLCQTPEGCVFIPDPPQRLECGRCSQNECVTERSVRLCEDGQFTDEVPCADLERAQCLHGQCGVVCNRDKRACVGNEVHTCGLPSDESFVEDCGEEICERGECLPKFCDPGSVVCVGTSNIGTCNSTGTAVSGDTEPCRLGWCKDGVCRPLEPAQSK